MVMVGAASHRGEAHLREAHGYPPAFAITMPSRTTGVIGEPSTVTAVTMARFAFISQRASKGTRKPSFQIMPLRTTVATRCCELENLSPWPSPIWRQTALTQLGTAFCCKPAGVSSSRVTLGSANADAALQTTNESTTERNGRDTDAF